MVIAQRSLNGARTWSSVVFHSMGHDWYGRQHSYQAFARNLAQRYPVLYVSTPVPWARAGQGTRCGGGYLSEDAGVHIFAPSIPMGARFRQRVAWWRHLQDAITAQAVRRALRHLDFNPAETLLLCMNPDSLPLIRSSRWAASALWIADDWEIPDMHAVLQAVDVVLAASPPTMEFARTAGARCVAALGGGVDRSSFVERPRAGFSALAHARRPLVGYAGGISARLDFPLLRRVAEELDGTVILVGPTLDDVGRRELEALVKLPNVIWVGHKDEDDSPDYVASFDVGLIPYVKVRHTLGCNPAKLYEYLAAGVAVVATDLPLLRYFADVISVAPDANSFVSAVQLAVGPGNHPQGIRRRKEVAACHSYETVVDLLIEQTSRVKSGREPIPPERAWRVSSD